MRKVLTYVFLFLFLSVSVYATLDPNNLIAYYELGNTTDIHNGHNGSNNGVTFTTGDYVLSDASADFEKGDSDYIEIPDHSSFSFTDGAGTDKPFSLSVWVKLESSASNSIIMSKTNYNGAREYQIGILADNRLYVYLTHVDASAYIAAFSVSTVPDNVWTHLSLTYDASETWTGFEMKINNVSSSTTSGSSGSYTGVSDTGLNTLIGARMTSGTKEWFFDGLIDELALFNYTMTDAEIDDIYNDGTGFGYNFSVAPPSPLSNYILNATNIYNGSKILSFEATVGGITQSTTNGTLNFLENGTIFNVEVQADDYFNFTTTWNITQHLQVNMTPYPIIIVSDHYDNQTISSFTVELKNNTFAENRSTTSGVLLIDDLLGAYNVSIWNISEYFDIDYREINLSGASKHYFQTYQSIVRINVTSVLNTQYIQTFNLTTPINTTETTIGTVILYPNKGENYWNISGATWFNTGDLLFNVTLDYQNFTVVNVYDTDIWFRNNISNTLINPSCSVNGSGNFSGSYHVAEQTYSEATINCTLSTFNDLGTILPSNIPQNLTYYMQPAQLVLMFSENTTGYVVWESTVNGTDGFTFNASQVVIQQSGIALGYVSVVFNDGQQLYEYYNDQDTTINQYLEVISPDLIQPVKLWDGAQTVEGKIDVYKLSVNDTFVKIYSAFTDNLGEVSVNLDDANSYKFIGTATGYTAGVQIEYIAGTTAEEADSVILVTLGNTLSTVETVTISTNCPNGIEAPQDCDVTVTSSETAYSIAFNYSQNGVSTYTTYSDSTSVTETIAVMNYTIVDVFLNGNYTASFEINFINKTNATVQPGFTESDRSWILEDPLLAIAFVFLLLLMGAIIGLLINNKFPGWGSKTGTLAIILGGGYVLPILWGIGLVFFIWIIYDYFKGTGG